MAMKTEYILYLRSFTTSPAKVTLQTNSIALVVRQANGIGDLFIILARKFAGVYSDPYVRLFVGSFLVHSSVRPHL